MLRHQQLLVFLLAFSSVGFFICSIWLYLTIFPSHIIINIPNAIEYCVEPEIEEENYTIHHHLLPEDIPDFRVKDVDCYKLFKKDYHEISEARIVQSLPRVSDYQYVTMTMNCSEFLRQRRYVLEPLTADEANFPIAFSILIYKEIGQFERLLRSIYRPQNYYCIHVDTKSPEVFQRAATELAGCFENVFVSSRSVNIKWGEYSVLEADLVCMEDLWTRYKRWRYFINLTGQEFPLKTNGDIVKILRAYAGANNIEGTVERYVYTLYMSLYIVVQNLIMLKLFFSS